MAAGVFLWSRRNQVSDQLGNLADRISERREDLRCSGTAPNEGWEATASQRGGDGRSQREIAEEALTLKETGAAA